MLQRKTIAILLGAGFSAGWLTGCGLMDDYHQYKAFKQEVENAQREMAAGGANSNGGTNGQTPTTANRNGSTNGQTPTIANGNGGTNGQTPTTANRTANPPLTPSNSAPRQTESGANVKANFIPISNNPISATEVILPPKPVDVVDHQGLTPVAPPTEDVQQMIQRAVDDTNKLRAEKGLPPLSYDPSLAALASVRAREIVQTFKHQRPDKTPFDSGLQAAANYAAGENIAGGYNNADQTVLDLWRNSSGHYQNMINANYQKIGIGYYYAPNSKYKYYWVQVFSGAQGKSKYYFSDSVASQTPQNINGLKSMVRFDSAGRLTLNNNGASFTPNNAANAYQTGALQHKIYATARRYKNGDYAAVVQEPTGAFSYQTFGELVNKQGVPVQYFNIGVPTQPAENQHFQATYRGASLGDVGQKSHVYADVVAKVDFGAQKTMTLQMQNSQIAQGDIVNQRPAQGLTPAPSFDFSEQLQWHNGQFQGSSANARFYGANGEEMGGQFSRQVDNARYRGVFGLRKQ